MKGRGLCSILSGVAGVSQHMLAAAQLRPKRRFFFRYLETHSVQMVLLSLNLFAKPTAFSRALLLFCFGTGWPALMMRGGGIGAALPNGS